VEVLCDSNDCYHVQLLEFLEGRRITPYSEYKNKTWKSRFPQQDSQKCLYCHPDITQPPPEITAEDQTTDGDIEGFTVDE